MNAQVALERLILISDHYVVHTQYQPVWLCTRSLPVAAFRHYVYVRDQIIIFI